MEENAFPRKIRAITASEFRDKIRYMREHPNGEEKGNTGTVCEESGEEILPKM